METPTFIPTHPAHVFDPADTFDYSERDSHFIQTLKAAEALRDIDAYILDFKNEKILYATRNCSLLMGSTLEEINTQGLRYYEQVVLPEDVGLLAQANARALEMFYSYSTDQRPDAYYTFDLRMRGPEGRTVLMNHKITVLDLTVGGVLRLGLCVISFPTGDRPGNAYLKWNDHSRVMQVMPTGGLAEVKTQKLTPKAMTILRLASNGKTEAETAKRLGISLYTVKWHKKQIFARLGVRNIAEAIQWMNNQKRLVKKQK